MFRMVISGIRRRRDRSIPMWIMGLWIDECSFYHRARFCGEFGVGHRVGGACLGDFCLELFLFLGVSKTDPVYFWGQFCFLYGACTGNGN